MVRLSFLQNFNQGLRGMLNLQSQLAKTQNQVSTGKRVVTPADDPVASARILQVNQDQSRIGQYVKNADYTENRLSLEETQLDAVMNILIRTRELTIQAGNGTLGQSERQALASELSVRLDELFDLANTRDSNGEFIFAGFQGSVPPFSVDQAGNYVYQGDDGQRQVQVASTTQIPISDSGKGIFVDVPSAQNHFFTAGNAGNTGSGQIFPGAIDQANYDAQYPEDYIITFNAGAGTYDIARQSDGVAVVTAAPYAGTPIVIDQTATLGFEVSVTGVPATGDTFFVESTGKQSIMQTLSNLRNGLNSLTDSPADQAQLSTLFADTLDNLILAEEHISSYTSEIGARQNTLDSVREMHSGIDLVNDELLSELRDLDYAEALSRLSTETFLLEASQQSFARISNLSLFNFIR